MARLGSVALLAAVTLLAAAAPGYAAGSSTRTVDRLERFWSAEYGTKTTARAALAANEVPSDLLAKAQPDECYKAGADYTPKTAGKACPDGFKDKVNQAYVWGLTKSGDDLWFGTAPNVLCLVFSGYLGQTDPTENDAYACEFGQSGFKKLFAALPAQVGDWRPSKLYRYRLNGEKLEDVGAQLTGDDAMRLTRTLGIRSAGSVGRLVLFAGPSLSLGGGLNLFAFDGQTGQFVASTTIAQYDNIRRWIVAGGKLYTAVGKTGGGGAVLRWSGDPQNLGTKGAPNASLFTFEEVGTMPGEGADLAEHEGRIYATTWPEGGQVAGLYRTAELGTAGVPATTDPMETIWEADDYEPDPVTARTYGGGALASFEGKLVWGTMHVPGTALLGHMQAYRDAEYGGSPSTPQTLAATLGTWRAVAIFSAEKIGTPDENIDLLYGNDSLPVYDPDDDRWETEGNNLGESPQLGTSGFGDFFNNYTWAMGTTKRGLYVGTMDHSFLVNKAIHPLIAQISGKPIDEAALELPAGRPGADLLRFSTLKREALDMSRAGVGNYTNYGVRTMVAEDDRLYVGTANPMNLMTSRSDDVPEGGWELRRVGPKQEFPPVVEEEEPQQQPTVVNNVTQVVAGSQSSSQCTPRRRKQFTLRLGLKVKQAARSQLGNLRTVTATVGGKKLTTKRGKTGIDVAVDLRDVKGKQAQVRVVLSLRKAVKATAKGKSKATKRIVRSFRYTVCQ